jgi:hypothetical protein
MDPHSFDKLDPDPHSPKKLDPDPHKVNADPKHWLKHTDQKLPLLVFATIVFFRSQEKSSSCSQRICPNFFCLHFWNNPLYAAYSA